MDDIQTLIYFALIVIWFLSRVFTKGKKKKPKGRPVPSQPRPVPGQTETQQPPTPNVTFEDILRELTGAPVTEPPKPQPAPEYREVDVPEMDIPAMEEVEEVDYDTPAPPTSHPDIVVREGAFKEFMIKEEKGPQAAREVFQMLKNKQGLKQAIILQAILDRPYK